MKFKRLEAKSKNTKSIVIFMHGYGADGADLLSIGHELSNHLPDTLFIAPDAPAPMEIQIIATNDKKGCILPGANIKPQIELKIAKIITLGLSKLI